MKQTAIILIVLGTFITGNPSARADSENPFGFETNTHPLKYEYCQRTRAKKFKGASTHYWYRCSSAPRMHPDIEYILLKFVEDVGLCIIDAASFEYSNKIDLFKDQIAQKYGPPTYKREDGSYVWNPEARYPGLGNVEAILVEKSVRGGADRVSVFFFFKADTTCLEKIDEHRARAF